MTHGDDDGILLPPKVASSHAVLLPIFRNEDEKTAVMNYTETLARELRDLSYDSKRLRIEVDDRDIGGTRGWEWIKKGIPIRVEIGPRDIAQNSVVLNRRDKPHKEKLFLSRDRIVRELPQLLDEIQKTMFKRAFDFKKSNSVLIDDRNAFYEFFTPKNPEKAEIHGGFAYSHWCGSEGCESKIKEDLGATIRCIPLDAEKESGGCIYCRKPSRERVVFAKAY
jgi:prolyl-tRNA synthetase